jgi:quercetin dioxygenase-like cupin family protein
MDAIVHGPGGGEGVSERVRILADLEHVAITESVYASGDAGPDPHIHHEHADTFYVLGGSLVFELGREAQRFEAAAGTFVAAPAGVVHTFRNEGPADARFLNFHAPGCGFGRYLRDMAADRDTSWFDTAEPPADGGPPASEALYVPAGDGEHDAALVWKCRRDELAVVEALVEPGFHGHPAHLHETHTNAFYVLGGTLELRLGDAPHAAGTGTFALAPPGVVHTFANAASAPTRLLIVLAPAREARRALRGEYDFVPV